MTDREDVLQCSECGLSPWHKHCCTCEPCVVKRIERKTRNARAEGLEEAARIVANATFPQEGVLALVQARAKEIREGKCDG